MSIERALRVRCTAERRKDGRCAAWAVRGTDLCVAHGDGAPPISRSWATRCGAHRSDGGRCRSWAVRGARVCRVHGGVAPAVRAAADRRWDALVTFERGVRERAIKARDDYVARAALRSWVADALGREPADGGIAFVADRFEAEAIAGGAPSVSDLAPRRVVAAEAVPLEFFVEAVARERGAIRQALGA
jgi:hypothetical protein